MKEIIYKVKQIASFPTSILLSGPSGAGKEVIANLIHHESDRKDMPFIKVNCGAIPEQLIESELFGYEKGEIPLALQVKLLRVLQEKQIQRLGGSG